MSTPYDKSHSTEPRKHTSKICPYLGLEVDPQTSYQYTSSGNYCHNMVPPRSVDTDYQQETCLTSNFSQCVIYKSDGWKGSLPGNIIAKHKRTNKSLYILIIIIISLAIVAGGVYLVLSNIVHIPAIPIVFLSNDSKTNNMQGLGYSSTAHYATITPTGKTQSTVSYNQLLGPATSEFTPSSTPTPQDTPTPSLVTTHTITPYLPTPGPDLKTPFGPNKRFAIYIVETGESLSSIAESFQTSIEVIQGSNVLIEGASVWPGTVLVILPGEKRTDDLHKYIAILVEQPTNLTYIAQENNTTIDQLRYLNDLGENDIVPGQRWIIIQIPDNG